MQLPAVQNQLAIKIPALRKGCQYSVVFCQHKSAGASTHACTDTYVVCCNAKGYAPLRAAATGNIGLHTALERRGLGECLRRISGLHRLGALCMGGHQILRLLLSHSSIPRFFTLLWASSVYLAVVICT